MPRGVFPWWFWIPSSYQDHSLARTSFLRGPGTAHKLPLFHRVPCRLHKPLKSKLDAEKGTSLPLLGNAYHSISLSLRRPLSSQYWDLAGRQIGVLVCCCLCWMFSVYCFPAVSLTHLLVQIAVFFPLALHEINFLCFCLCALPGEFITTHLHVYSQLLSVCCVSWWLVPVHCIAWCLWGVFALTADTESLLLMLMHQLTLRSLARLDLAQLHIVFPDQVPYLNWRLFFWRPSTCQPRCTNAFKASPWA